MIGHSVKLYDMVLQFLRTLFLRTKNIHYCTLRAELLMALHDLEVKADYNIFNEREKLHFDIFTLSKKLFKISF